MGGKFNKTIKGALFLTILFLCIVICKVRASGYYDDYFEGYSIQASEQELYNETNTFDFVGINVNNSYYNTDQRNSNIVNNETSLTIITHGLGGSASNWSNEVHDGNYSFAKDNSSIFNRLELLTKENQNIKTDIFLAAMFSKNTFKLFDLNDPMNREGNCYNPKRASSRLNNISNHIIVIFESSDSTASNDYLYQELNFMISKVIYDIKVLNGGYLPKINLIGHSRGGITNLQYALDHPDLVDGLFSIGTPYFGSDTAATDLGKGMCSDEDGIVYD